jgi:uncharacterized YigZ family protein
MDSPNSQTYKTIANPSIGLFKEKGSKFLAFTFPVSSEEEVKAHLDDLRKKYHDARHHCYAYRINPRNLYERANDDGEPRHSAGTPILGQLLSVGVINILVVVVRYFGGTKLGVPGLINAYKTAARLALDAAEIVEEAIQETITIAFDYPDLNNVMRIVKAFNANIEEQKMTTNITMRLALTENALQLMQSQLATLKTITFIRTKTPL